MTQGNDTTPRPSDADLNDRLRWLVKHAEEFRGYRFCVFCKKKFFGPARLRRHLKDAHTPAIENAPASIFK